MPHTPEWVVGQFHAVEGRVYAVFEHTTEAYHTNADGGRMSAMPRKVTRRFEDRVLAVYVTPSGTRIIPRRMQTKRCWINVPTKPVLEEMEHNNALRVLADRTREKAREGGFSSVVNLIEQGLFVDL